jgi:hypothetical protein
MAQRRDPADNLAARRAEGPVVDHALVIQMRAPGVSSAFAASFGYAFSAPTLMTCPSSNQQPASPSASKVERNQFVEIGTFRRVGDAVFGALAGFATVKQTVT